MKKKNSVSEFSSERNLRLLEIFRKHLAARSQDAAEKAFGLAASTPAPRFWVSESRAAAVVGRLLAGRMSLQECIRRKGRCISRFSDGSGN